jgi:protein-S-isoprenylcysteine O-methyltransferase Ste14
VLGRHLRSFVLPLTAAGIVPAALLGFHWSIAAWPLALGGALLFSLGLAMLAWTVGLFSRLGRGTLAPWDPTRRLVVAGPYAHLRNPMISGVTAMIVGEALASGSTRIGAWAAVFVLVNHVYFVVSEEPGLVERFGAEYEEYVRHVPRWIPRRRPWR